MISWIAAIATDSSGKFSVPLNASTIVTLLHISVRVIVITLFAMSSTRTSAKDFVKVVNTSAWPDGVAFIIGSNGANWCFLCLDFRHTPGRRNPLTWHKHAKSFDLDYIIASRSGLLRVLAVLVNLDPGDTTDYSGIAIF